MTVGGCAYYWAGLPVVCAAPLHGPAFDIVNTNQASPDAYRKAVYLARDVAAHRIVMNTKARVAKVSREDVLTEILGSVRQPASFMERK
jgi:hypothetical protein